MRPGYSSIRQDVISISPSFANAQSGDIYDILTGAGKTWSHFKAMR